jgi:hypothetical protein
MGKFLFGRDQNRGDDDRRSLRRWRNGMRARRARTASSSGTVGDPEAVLPVEAAELSRLYEPVVATLGTP